MGKGSGGGGRIGAGTTAQLRTRAMAAAESGNFKQAARLLSAAIRRYPAGGLVGQLGRRDVANMRETIRSYRND